MNAIAKTESSALSAMTEADLTSVLRSSLYPGASAESIKMVLGYCRAAGLDPMQKPVHIVPMWDAKSGSMRDVIMPGVNLYRIQAMRSGECAGVSEPDFGPDVSEKIGGAEITYPSWCRVTIKRRLQTGEIVEFTSREFWKENYAVRGGKEKSIAPNAMWTKRPYGQLAKCAEAQALRKAFPEIASQATADEMEGKTLRPDEIVNHDTGEIISFDITSALDLVESCNTVEELNGVFSTEGGKAEAAKDYSGYKALRQACKDRKEFLIIQANIVDVEPAE